MARLLYQIKWQTVRQRDYYLHIGTELMMVFQKICKQTLEGAITEITKIKHSCSVLFLAVVCIDSGCE